MVWQWCGAHDVWLWVYILIQRRGQTATVDRSRAREHAQYRSDSGPKVERLALLVTSAARPRRASVDSSRCDRPLGRARALSTVTSAASRRSVTAPASAGLGWRTAQQHAHIRRSLARLAWAGARQLQHGSGLRGPSVPSTASRKQLRTVRPVSLPLPSNSQSHRRKAAFARNRDSHTGSMYRRLAPPRSGESDLSCFLAHHHSCKALQ
ncbi:hypothetical protein BCV70DRAFT_23497 [Testicularia cyperi]|uniref:Uncharacterized protein n=1 Tax=Testicularia cyperi TaxID=1882483 RepID=A0A317XZV1_9BASI|nr:hypothetical protein BCV70DRAFT_23497 [Testicularia cyperi]